MNFVWYGAPFEHWVATDFLPKSTISQINREWPTEYDDRWHVEHGSKAKKCSLLFPQRLTPTLQSIAEEMYGAETVTRLSDLVDIDLLPDPWFKEGPIKPRLGGGMHEIQPGGLLKVHVDFNRHPAGLTRCLNLLVYLNEDWDESWGGALELHGKTVKTIEPKGGTAVMFVTTPESWHGHPAPLACPEGRTRRSLALYYYRRESDPVNRPTTVYR